MNMIIDALALKQFAELIARESIEDVKILIEELRNNGYEA